MDNCPFCERIANNQYDVTEYAGIVSFEPLNPVTPGHKLYVPRKHVTSAADSPIWAGQAVAAAAYDIIGDANIITSIGEAATQTVQHLHVHRVPRRTGDGLSLPWTGQAKEKS